MYRQAIEEIKNAKTIYIATHSNPDGDAIGSSIGLCLALRKLNKEVKVVLPKYASIFGKLPHIDDRINSMDREKADLLIVLDSSDMSRVEITDEDVAKCARTLCIDHHKANKNFTDVVVRDDKSPATAELIYNLIDELGIEIDKDIASLIYAGIMTDTGSFKYSSTRPETFKIASKLIEKGIDFSKIARDLLDTYKEGKLKLVGKYINNIESLENGKIYCSLVTLDEIKDFGLSDEDTEGMTNYGLMVENVEVSIYVREQAGNIYKVSLRSKEKVNVADIAISFSGGGHAKAAGFSTTKDEFIKVKEILINKIKEQLYK